MDNINFIKVSSDIDGEHKVHELIINQVDEETMLWVSGGSSPRELYRHLSLDLNFKPAAAALVDERFGPKGHPASNEQIIEQTGLLESLRNKKVSFHPILWNQSIGNWKIPDMEKTAETYNLVVEKLINEYKKHFLIMGIGPDGHTAGMLADMPKTDQYVIAYESELHINRHRITLTPAALEELAKKKATFMILLFGADKSDILKIIQKDEGHGGLPASIFGQLIKHGAQVHVITDQII